MLPACSKVTVLGSARILDDPVDLEAAEPRFGADVLLQAFFSVAIQNHNDFMFFSSQSFRDRLIRCDRSRSFLKPFHPMFQRTITRLGRI